MLWVEAICEDDEEDNKAKKQPTNLWTIDISAIAFVITLQYGFEGVYCIGFVKAFVEAVYKGSQ